MKNVFMLYMPPGNLEAMVHYEDTIKNKVDPKRILQHTDQSTTRALQQVFGNRNIAVWGSRDSRANRSKYDRMQPGDDILIVVGDTIKLLGKIAWKTVNPGLSRELWKNIRGDTTEGWDLIYFIANPKEIELPFNQFCRLFGYKPDYRLRGFTTVADDRLDDFYSRYDDLYSVLTRLKQGFEPEAKPDAEAIRDESEPYAAASEEMEALSGDDFEKIVTEHTRIQWLLLSMGKKAGEQVWIPKGDQKRIQNGYDYAEFETTFATGLDAPTKYIENIDVIWKAEYRIDAAFEVENSTSIYSGLLRFADLTMVAPNTLYPMFIVAPSERRSQVRDQLARPIFKHLHLSEKVRYLPYETVQEVNDFFADQGSGLNVDVLTGKSEKLEVA